MTLNSSVLILATAIALLVPHLISSFTLQPINISVKVPRCHAVTNPRKTSSSALLATNADLPQSVKSATDQIEDCKRELIRMCDAHDLGSGISSGIEGKIEELEKLGREVSRSTCTGALTRSDCCFFGAS